jgi:hypothetical protein
MRFFIILLSFWAIALHAQESAWDASPDAALIRERSYQEAGLPTPERARLEALLLIRQVQGASTAALARARAAGADEAQARGEVEAFLEEELLKVDSALVDDLRAAATSLFDRRTPRPSALLLERMAAQSLSRQEVLEVVNEGIRPKNNPTSGVSGGTGLSTSARGIRRYRSRAQLLQALVSGDESERWTATTSITQRSTRMVGHQESFSAQVAVEFLGSRIAAGPAFTFSRKIATSVDIRAEGGSPPTDERGYFDLIARDGSNRPVVRNGVPQSRFVFFTCEAEITIESERLVNGGFKVFGAGAEGEVKSLWANNVTLTSRRVLVPDTVDGRQVTFNDLSLLCHQDFMGARTTNGRTVRDNLRASARNLISSLVYQDSALECVEDRHCDRWYQGVLGIHRYRTAGRCVRARGNVSLLTCQLRGQVGANCAVVQNGQHLSSGYFEYPCDRGLRCVVTRTGRRSFWNPEPWVGECRR